MSSGESDGYSISKKLQGLAAEEVPNPRETKGYWYTRYLELRDAVKKADYFLNMVGDPIACHIVLFTALEDDANEFQTAQNKRI